MLSHVLVLFVFVCVCVVVCGCVCGCWLECVRRWEVVYVCLSNRVYVCLFASVVCVGVFFVFI